jgi:succinate dehydrogenase / fumarate reductase flavoprotein subunit
LHGGNRLGANSLLETVVFGRRAGRCAAEYAKTLPTLLISDTAIEPDRQLVRAIVSRQGQGDRAAALRLEMGTTMNRYVSVFREQEGMETASRRINDLKARWPGITIQDKGQVFNTGLVAALELGFMLDCAETIIVGALTRTESRGAHFRTDYLNRDDEQWLKHVLLYHTPSGTPHVEYLPVRITQWQPQIRVY